ncbi:hypothetical protein [Chitinophaga rhizophila]|uniref:Uncharacterized protein n=1 Tax=Chitinophaga rhizophila TaxID=2866212 RepID=A0ABS7G7E7_9BACT|nr:hypothetical protein [Chitinophaga rhizophila]MBW8683573.1 hypothetical protein [Chitinophaga rhizophila]
MDTPKKDVLAEHKTEQFPQPEFIDVTAAYPGDDGGEHTAPETNDEQNNNNENSGPNHQEQDTNPDTKTNTDLPDEYIQGGA